MPSALSKESRLEIRLDAKTKSKLEDAAEVRGLTLSGYVLSVALPRAEADLASQRMLTLGERDRDAILKALENPPKPNAALRKAAQGYLARHA